MGTVKVGDKVRVVVKATCHGFDVGSIVTVAETYVNVVGVTDGIRKYYLDPDEYEPIAPNRIVVGGRYTGVNGDKWECVAIKGDVAWLACIDAYGEVSGSAYTFNLDGTCICLNSGYNIKFEPVVEWVKVNGGFVMGRSENSTVSPAFARHIFTLDVPFIDGKPDWSQAKVTPA